MKNRRILLSLGLSAIFVSGCAGTPPRDQFFRLNDPQPPAQQAHRSNIDTLEIGRFNARELLEAERHILVRGSNNAISWQPNALWVEPPAGMIRRALLHYLRGSGLFHQVVSHEQQIVARYRLIGTLLVFERDLDSNRVYVELDLSMIDLRERRLAFAKRYRISEPTTDTTVNMAVSAFDRTVAALAADITRDLKAKVPQTNQADGQ